MKPTPKARAGIPIAVKLVLATSIVVACAVGAATWFGQTTIGDLTATQIKERRASGEKGIQRTSELVTQAAAQAIAHPLGNGQLADVKVALDGALADDKTSGDNRVMWMVVTDQSGATYAAGTPPAPARQKELEALLAGGTTSDGVSRAPTSTDSSEWVYGTPIKFTGEGSGLQVGVLRVGVTTAGLTADLSNSLADAQVTAKSSRDRVWLVSLVILAIGIVLAALQGVQVARPIKALTVQAQRIASGDLQARVAEGRGDELGALARTFNFMTDELVSLLHANATKVSLEKEMELARQVQQAMLPPDTLDTHGAIKVVGYCQPASSCGGDWWTYRKMADGRMLLVVGDATGHGIHSAMIAATARGAVEALAAVDERLLTPDQVLRAIDSAIRQVGDHNVLMTAFAAVFDSNNGALHYANAGQNFPYVIKLGAERMLGEASIIAASGNPLGDRNIPVEIRRGSLQMQPGDLFVCFTDGVVERANPAGKLFGDRRLRGVLTGQPLTDDSSLVALRDRLVGQLDRYAEGKLADDDITFVLCQFDPQSVRPSRVSRGAA